VVGRDLPNLCPMGKTTRGEGEQEAQAMGGGAGIVGGAGSCGGT
jgi:hypothetical protein